MENDVEPNLNQVVKLIPERPTILRYYNIFSFKEEFYRNWWISRICLLTIGLEPIKCTKQIFQ
jgi:hypothetical protein